MSLKLIILGLLCERNMHPYEIKQLMKERHLDDFIKIQAGSLYYSIDQLKGDGCIDIVEIIQDSKRADKTIYAITEKGKDLFQKLLIKQFSSKEMMVHPFYAALLFAHFGDSQKIKLLVEQRIEELEREESEMLQVYLDHIPQVAKGVLHLMAGSYEFVSAELKWLRRLLKDAADDNLGTVGEPLDMDVPSGR